MIIRRLSVLAVLALFVPAGARAADLDPYLPADTESYLSVNVKAVLASPIVKKYALDAAREALKEMELNGLLAELGFDPFKDLDRIQLASPTTADKDRGLAILTGTFDAAKLKKKADDAARDDSERVKAHKVNLGGGATHVVYEVAIPGQDLTMFVALVGNKTLLASPGKDYVVGALKQGRQAKKPALKHKGFQGVLENLDSKQAVSLAMLGTSLGKNEWVDLLPQEYRDALTGIEVVGGGLGFGNEVKLDLVVSTKADQDARVLRDALSKGVKLAQAGLALLGDRKELSLLGEVLNTVKVGSKGKTLSLSARLTADVLADFMKGNQDD
jgi:hypothetical protein